MLKDLVGGLAGEDVKYLYWCWENKKILNEVRLKARPAQTIIHSNTKGDIKEHLIIPPEKPRIRVVIQKFSTARLD